MSRVSLNQPAKVDFTAFRHPILAVAGPACHAPYRRLVQAPVAPSDERFPRLAKAKVDRIWQLQGDPPIRRTATGWVYAYGETQDAPPPAAVQQRALFGEGEGRCRATSTASPARR